MIIAIYDKKNYALIVNYNTGKILIAIICE